MGDRYCTAASVTRVVLVVALAWVTVATVIAFVAASPADAQLQPDSAEQADLVLVELTFDGARPEQLDALSVDIIRTISADGATSTVRAVVPDVAIEELRSLGVAVDMVVADATPHPADLQRQASVWKRFDGPGGIRSIVEQTTADHPAITELVTLGQSHQGRPIQAIRVTANAANVDHGARPAVAYVSAQHAREWITVETNRRFLDHIVQGYGNDPAITSLLDTTELWFVLVVNPDGYDYTFTDQRLWRKNLRDNNGNGLISFVDGVDLNRNARTQWGYDDEGSSGTATSQIYRGPTPGSEPESVAMDVLLDMADPEFFFNIHSAASLMLYGNGWQTSTVSPDDHIGRALVGDDANPAIVGYNPGLSAELYNVNGDLSEHAHIEHGAFGVTMELETCDDAAALLPNDAFNANYCSQTGRSVFEFPDDETLINLVFERNRPLYMAAAQSAQAPEDPVSLSGYSTPDIHVRTFDVAHGDTQQIAAEVKRSLGSVAMQYRIDSGPVLAVPASNWDGGERYGAEFDTYYREVRGTVSGVDPGEEVTVWFTAGGVVGDSFTYTVVSDSADVLVIADEDYDGFSPEQPGVDAPRYSAVYTNALEVLGYSHNVWDIVALGAPDPLGVLGQYDKIVWERGDNRITQTQADNDLVDPFQGSAGGFGVAAVHHFLTVAVRDYLNEGGEIVAFGRHLGSSVPGIGGWFYGRDGDPSSPCASNDPFADCLLHSDDFLEYWLGIRSTTVAVAPSVISTSDPLTAASIGVTGQANYLYPIDEPPGRPLAYPPFAAQVVAGYGQSGPAGLLSEGAISFGFGLEQLGDESAAAELLGSALSALGAEDPILPDTSLRHVVTCLAGNGRVDTNIVNDGASPQTYRLEFGGLSPRQVSVAPLDWARMPITGRPDGPHTVVVKRGGVIISDTTITVDCDDASPAVTTPEVTIMNGCRNNRGYVIAQFANNRASQMGYIIEFAAVRNRSTTAAAFGGAARAVTGRPDGPQRMKVRTTEGDYIFDERINIDCQSD